MKVFQSVYMDQQWSNPLPEHSKAELVMLFGSEALLKDSALYAVVRDAFPSAHVVGCTTSGEIFDDALLDDSLTLTAVSYQHACVYVESDNVDNYSDAQALGQALVEKIPKNHLRHVFLVSDGQQVNGSDLVTGVQQVLPKTVTLTGGLAGDKYDFLRTHVRHNTAVEPGMVAAVCFYGDSLVVGTGQYGGWRGFGPVREITKSEKNTVYEIDGQPALALYKSFLGEYAQDLPGSALLYPLSLTLDDGSATVVRTILSIDEQTNSMTFAGNMPQGASCQLMHANTEQLLDGAEIAANTAQIKQPHDNDSLAILVSCVGRRLVMSKRAVEEVEIIRDILPETCAMTGFYSYGEVSPVEGSSDCTLHNQTMTITVIGEQ